jgi:Cytochrome P460
MHRFKLTSTALVVSLGLSSLAGGADEVPYPEGYRSWFHVKSQIATKDHPRFAQIGGIHHIYANAAGVNGYKSGTFADGSVLILDVFALTEEAGSLVEGERRWLGVMQKDSEKYKATGGWGFENFAGDSKTDRNVAVNGAIDACVTCHMKRKDSDLVFSKLRE